MTGHCKIAGNRITGNYRIIVILDRRKKLAD
jgi:hypothetical protein